ncbi:SAM-dependent methyltransferase [Methylophaga nitratireducenticrescens]|uniref:class I SAM-dependent methyltransferase n=1 Tax=Methylophaga nitratireducenticrescens TaxID=754476 RepID=UPI00059E9AB3|nr:class I SAM-dependent methyltransferase [Methylophaga nitratireducenticrescens]ASF49136.1 SAM-dependent methyltransferase [Methylophaga nitratireducenticrescens]
MNEKNHWEKVYTTKRSDEVSWFQPHAAASIDIIRKLENNTEAHILDVGGGASTLVDDLLSLGYSNIKVLDISSAALEVAKTRLGERANAVEWIVEDVTKFSVPKHSIDVWHDRAVFHFLNDQKQREKYVKAVLNAVKPGGHVIVSTFSLDGPEKCSGLLVQRYDAESLHDQFGEPFVLLGHEYERHKTPFGTNQNFIYCYCRVANA